MDVQDQKNQMEQRVYDHENYIIMSEDYIIMKTLKLFQQPLHSCNPLAMKNKNPLSLRIEGISK